MKKRIAAAALAAILLRLALLTGGARALLSAPGGVNVNVVVSAASPSPAPSPPPPPPEETPSPLPGAPPEPSARASASPAPEAVFAPDGTAILPTTIPGGVTLRNATSLEPDVDALLAAGPRLRLPREGVQVLILHTHGSEAYTPDGDDVYVASDPYRTQDRSQSVVRVGDELSAALEARGLTVWHDREIYDWPSYTGSYARSGAAVTAFLEAHPETAVVIDLHRDALGTDETIYKTVSEQDGTVSSQLMLVVGTGENGLPHPDWRENLALALLLQQAAAALRPTLMRPVSLVRERYNQQLAPGMLILEVGSSGNTLREALAAVDAFAEAVAPALLGLMENG